MPTTTLDSHLSAPNSSRGRALAVKPYSGATLYELSEEGLIVSHTETWSISALEAFV